MYQPILGRFLSRDPLGAGGVDVLYDNNSFGDRLTRMRDGYRGGDIGDNLYMYVYNNPVRWTDPSGLEPNRLRADSPDCLEVAKGRCGLEIGTALLKTLDAVDARFQAMSEDARDSMCSDVIGRFLQWDIAIAGDRRCGGGVPCQDCVEVFGIKHDKWEVNYALYGKLSALCGRWRWTTTLEMFFYKFYIKIPSNLVSGEDWHIDEYNVFVERWLEFGYFHGEYATKYMKLWAQYLVRATDDPRFAECDKCPVPAAQNAMTFTMFGGNDHEPE